MNYNNEFFFKILILIIVIAVDKWITPFFGLPFCTIHILTNVIHILIHIVIHILFC